MSIFNFAGVVLSVAIAAIPVKTAKEEQSERITEYTEDGQPVDIGQYIEADTEIKVLGYDKKTELYHVENKEFPKSDWFYASADDVAIAIPSVDLNELKKKPSSIVGESFTVEENLLLTDSLEVDGEPATKTTK